ncbi:Phosphoesterase, DHH family protein [Streptococcus sp. DD10]|uniref:DHH family phosphoesterase n=1 Tax=Streptococcus sp. DD10 TaxID=1777878 RepID=UPI000798D3E5|nr:DHH family phosphoesterase [Streptococcus sp. DD10]KXT74309.1 Phosphoesterase, DHH family protein [Streptococcus sp. DD10]
MKKFRLAPIHFMMVGILSFGFVAIAVGFFRSQFPLLVVLSVVLVFWVALAIYQQQIYELDDLEQIQYINNQAEASLASLLDKMPVGVVKVDQDGTIEWFNPYAELIFTKEDGDFDNEVIQKILKTPFEDGGKLATVADKRYAVYLDQSSNVFYFFDASNEYNATIELATTRPVIGVVSVDNYDDLENQISDSDISNINSFIANFVADFSKNYQLFYRRTAPDRFYLFTDYTVLSRLMAEKFSIIETFRMEAKEKNLSLTLSMGFSYGDGQHDEIGKVALLNLNLAEVRGGDQVVVKENDETKDPIYFGGGTASTVKRTRTRTRAMMTALSDKMKSADQVFIVGHKRLDMDALGASVGMQLFAQNVMGKAYVVYDPDDLGADITRAINALDEEGSTNLLVVSDAMTLVTKRSLLVMVDHSKTALTLSKEFYDLFDQTIVIDHHRRDEDFPKTAVITYIESGASSASELVTELIQFQNSKQSRLSKIQSSILMAGIMLDTKNFSSRVTSRTFDVASYLRTRGSDSVLIQEISATDFDEYRAINELILKGERLLPHVIVAVADESQTYSTVVISKAADTMLTMSHIEATFVVAKNTAGFISISARSRSKVNVQRVMEEMGGGGHFNLAAAQIENGDLTQVGQQLHHKILNELIRNKEE